MNIIEINDITKSYYSNDNDENECEVKALKGVSFNIKKGEFLSIMGTSGCGKTTLLKMIGAIEEVSSGEIYYCEPEKVDISKIHNNDRADIRRTKVGFVFQDFQLINSLSVEDNIILPLILDKVNYRECYKKAYECAKLLDIEKLMDRYPYKLSGGEKQRVAIARALINSPSIILADEPTGNLDSKNGKIVIDLLTKINRELNNTIVMVTHDANIASYTDRVLLLKDGLILDELVKTESMNRNDFLEIIADVTKEL